MTDQQYHDLMFNQRVILSLVAAGLILIAGAVIIVASLAAWMVRIGRESSNNLWLSRGLQTMTRDHTEKAVEKLEHVDQSVSEVKTAVAEVKEAASVAAVEAKQAAAAVASASASESGTKLRTLPPEPSPGK